MCFGDCTSIEEINQSQVDDWRVRIAAVLMCKTELILSVFQGLFDILYCLALTQRQGRKWSQHYYRLV
jgi:hypothetical protein